MKISTQKKVLEKSVDEIWQQMENLVEERNLSSPECWSDIDREYIALEGTYHKILEKLTALTFVAR